MSGFDDMFRENILDHYRHPRNRGTLEHPDITYEDANPLCGDRIRMDLMVKDDRIAQVRFSGVGCSISQAAASMLCEAVEGKRSMRSGMSRDDGSCWASSWARCSSSAGCWL
jgi:SUF system NifU family Fe-S assembly protein